MKSKITLLSAIFFIAVIGCKKETCSDGIQNQAETGVDCGGSCSPCPTCSDGVQNGSETAIDCGGSCSPCPSCNDGIKNQGETGIDCGGPCAGCVIKSPCTTGLTNNKITSSATTGLTSISATVSGSTINASSSDGNAYIKIGGTIVEGTYPLEQDPFPETGKALIDFRPIYQGNFLSTSGTLYIDDTGSQWVVEFCDVNCVNTAGNTSLSGRVTVAK